MIQLGPLGLKRGLKRIKNLIVEEISLVDNPAIRRRFLLIKRDSPEEASSGLEQRRLSSMEFEEIKDLEDGELMVFEREEELALPPDVVRQLKMVIGLLSKLIGYKYKAKYKYAKPAEKKSESEVEQAKKKKKDEEELPEEEKKKKEKKQEKETIIDIPKPEEKEVSQEVADSLKELKTLTENEAEIDNAEVKKKIDEIMEQLKAGSGGKE